MATIVNKDKRKMLVVLDDQSTNQVLPETTGDQVKINTIAGITSDNVQGALEELNTNANSRVIDAVNANGDSIVDQNNVAQMKDAVVKEAGKVTNKFTYKAHNKVAGTDVPIQYDGSAAASLDFDADDFVAVYSSGNDLGVKLVDKNYARRNSENTFTENNTFNKNVVIGGDLTVSGKSTIVDTQTLEVKDNLIVVAKDNAAALTSPAGMLVPKYDGVNNVALVVDNDGMAKVGKSVLDANGNVDREQSELQTLATRTGLVDGSLVKYDGVNETLVPVNTGDQIDEFIKFSNTSGIGLDEIHTLGGEQIFKEDTENAKYEIGTTSRDVQLVGKSAHPQYLEYGKTEPQNIVLETDVVHVAERSYTADKTKGTLKLVGQNSVGAEETDSFNGSENKELSFDPTDFTAIKTSNSYDVELSTVYTTPDLSQTIAGTYTAVMVNQKGVVQAGNRAFAFIDAGAAIPSDVMIGGLLFEAVE